MNNQTFYALSGHHNSRYNLHKGSTEQLREQQKCSNLAWASFPGNIPHRGTLCTSSPKKREVGIASSLTHPAKATELYATDGAYNRCRRLCKTGMQETLHAAGTKLANTPVTFSMARTINPRGASEQPSFVGIGNKIRVCSLLHSP